MGRFIPNENTWVGYTPGPVGQLAAPDNAAAAGVDDAGTLVAATYKYKVTAVNETGETAASTEASVTTTHIGGVNVTWDELDGAESYRIYGRSTGEHLVAEVGGETLEWLDTGLLVPNAAIPAPTIGTASNVHSPTISDVNEAVELTRYVTGLNFGSQGNSVPTPDLKRLFETSIEGTSTATASLDVYRDDEIDTVHDLLPRRTRGFMLIARYGGIPNVAGKKCEVWPIRVTSRTTANMQNNTAVTETINFAVPDEPDEDAVVVA